MAILHVDAAQGPALAQPDPYARLIAASLVVQVAGAAGILAAIFNVSDPSGIPALVVIALAIALWGTAGIAGILELAAQRFADAFTLASGAIGATLVFVALVSGWWFLVPLLGSATIGTLFALGNHLVLRDERGAAEAEP